MKRYFYSIVLLSIISCATGTVYAQVNARYDLVPEEENLNVFQQWLKWNNGGSLLIQHLTKQAMDYYDIRDNEISKLNSKSEWVQRQVVVKEKLSNMVGPFPAKGPLNPKITGIIKKSGYRIEKIIFEAIPGYYVTGCLYVPEGIKGKVPAILHVIGHNQEAFRAPLYQIISYNLVKKGMIVFAIDPPGQGEHVQYYDTTLKTSQIGYSVIEHCYFGNQLFLSGSSAARYFIRDGMRAIDYLLTRKEVDPERIGVTGFSGGGTVTTLVSAFDERVKVSVPCSWATTNKRQIETKGVQDAENVFIGGLSNGITLEDLIEVRAPKPTLMTFTSRDEYLTLQGAREANAEAKSAYRAFGLEDNLQMSEDDSKHWMTPKIRFDIYSFFMKHFNVKGDPAELEAEVLPQEELNITPTGQISTSFGGDMIFDVNRKETEILIADLEKSRKNIDRHLDNVLVKAKALSGFIAPSGKAEKAFINGRYQRNGYSVGKYAITGEGNYPIPILLFVPDDNREKHPALVFIHPDGKAGEAKPGGEIEKLVRKGFVVAAVDLLGTGETKNTAARGITDGYAAVLIGRSLPGIQAGDIVRVVKYLKTCEDVDSLNIGGIGIDDMCIPLIHAAAFEPSVKSITIIGSPVSYRSIAMNRIFRIGLTETGKKGINHPYESNFSWGVAGVLTAYDLPDLIGSMAPRKVAIAGLRDHALEEASDELIKQDMNFPESVYSYKGVSENLKIIKGSGELADLAEWGLK